ncbi:Reverse transcriptase zinc-binding domain [Macleaya cordata]|uniref:Reverse transcriptase zinc-binding domain n=1 Tax=Macleaya cordata TaxID=56857 RepID=A0A200QJ24_MACCD|nr:Reverse transcriptase zinc-binding domain [Macleaya cordata]
MALEDGIGRLYFVAKSNPGKVWERWLGNKSLQSAFPDLFAIAYSQDSTIKEMVTHNEDDTLSKVSTRGPRQQNLDVEGKDFSVRTYFEGLSKYSNDICPSEKIWNTIWPQKVAFFMWTVYKHKILTYDKLMDVNIAWCNLRKIASVIEGWCSFNSQSRRTKLIYSLIPSAICWTLWKERSEDMKGLAIENVIVNWKELIFEPP